MSGWNRRADRGGERGGGDRLTWRNSGGTQGAMEGKGRGLDGSDAGE